MNTLYSQSVPAPILCPSSMWQHTLVYRLISRFSSLILALEKKKDYDHLVVDDFMPALPKLHYEYIQCVEKNGLSSPVILLMYSSGNNTGNLTSFGKCQLKPKVRQAFAIVLHLLSKSKLSYHSFTHELCTKLCLKSLAGSLLVSSQHCFDFSTKILHVIVLLHMTFQSRWLMCVCMKCSTWSQKIQTQWSTWGRWNTRSQELNMSISGAKQRSTSMKILAWLLMTEGTIKYSSSQSYLHLRSKGVS